MRKLIGIVFLAAVAMSCQQHAQAPCAEYTVTMERDEESSTHTIYVHRSIFVSPLRFDYMQRKLGQPPYIYGYLDKGLQNEILILIPKGTVVRLTKH